DLTLPTPFKPISGKDDQAGGLIFRVQDKDNYYILRANALEDNVNFYIYRAGRRSHQEIDWSDVEQALGRSGQMMPGGVFRIGMPRTDLKVTVEDVPVQAGFALGSYAAFKQYDDGTMVMGDLVLLDQEVNAVMSGLFDRGF